MNIQILSKIANVLAEKLPELRWVACVEHEWLKFELPRTDEPDSVVWVRYEEEYNEPVYLEMMVGEDHSEPYFNKHTTLDSLEAVIDHLVASIAARDEEASSARRDTDG